MKFKMAENSLFAILLRSSWWISLAIGAAFVALAGALLPTKYFFVGAFGALPFFVIAGIAGWRQFRTPNPKQVAATLEGAAALSWAQFGALLETGLRQDGFTVERMDGDADFITTRAGRTAVVAAKRWKSAHLGLEPLQALQGLREKRDTHDAVFISTAVVTEKAAAYVRKHGIRMLAGAELARLIEAGRKRSTSATR
jgi:restriction system protein